MSSHRISDTDYEAAFNEGYDEAKERYVEELNRLRAEKAELREALEDLLNLKQCCHERAEAILDRLTNETEGK